MSEGYIFEETNFRVRYIVVAERVHSAWRKKGVKYITFDECIRFISERGECWENSGIGRRSIHYQWDPLINRIFEIANNKSVSSACRQKYIKKVLEDG